MGVCMALGSTAGFRECIRLGAEGLLKLFGVLGLRLPSLGLGDYFAPFPSNKSILAATKEETIIKHTKANLRA